MSIAKKNIYAINPEENYLDILAKEILNIADHNYEKLAETKIFLPSKRSAAALKIEFLEASGKKSLLMPDIYSLGDMDETDIELAELSSNINLEEKPMNRVIPKYKRIILLANIIKRSGVFGYDMNKISMHQAVKMAYSLAELIDEFHKHGDINVQNLKDILPEKLSKHKQFSLDFISFVENEYPKILAQKNYVDAVKKRNLLIERYINIIKKSPPDHNIIIAGSSGSINSTRNLIKAVSELQRGHIFLPYIDITADPEGILRSKSNHQYLIYKLLENLDITKEDIKLLGYQNANHAIEKIFSVGEKAFTHQEEGNKIENIKIIESENIIEEAKIISLIIREKLEEKKRIALITNNNDLAKFARQYLEKWSIKIDISSGIKFMDTKGGNFLLQICEFIASKGRAINFLSLIKHELCKNIPESSITTLEDHFRKKNISEVTSDIIRASYCADQSEGTGSPEILRKTLTHSCSRFHRMTIEKIISTAEKYKTLFKSKISDLYKDIYLIAETLSGGEFFESENFSEAAEIINFLINDEYSSSETEIEYLSEFTKNLFESIIIRPRFGVTSMAAILSPIEARLLNFDCVILGGMNYGSWPRQSFSVWLSDNMKNDAGIPESDFFTSLSSHDFITHLRNEEVIISRSMKDNGDITVESPFLSRLKPHLIGDTETKKYNNYLNQIENKNSNTLEIKKPYPTPPLLARPGKLSVTDIEKLIYNPYEIYVSKILKLKKLDDLEREAEVKDFGTFIHKVLEEFTNFHDLDEKKINETEFNKIVEKVFKNFEEKNIIANTWLNNCISMNSDIVRIEQERAKKIRKIFSEKKGMIKIPINNQEFEITCKADRIEISTDNKIIIADYKTGKSSIPDKAELNKLKKPQLLIESIILKKGGFDDIPEIKEMEKDVSEIVYFLISKSSKGPKLEIFSDFNLDTVEKNLLNLIADFLNSNKPFLISPRPDLTPKYREFKHLERLSS